MREDFACYHFDDILGDKKNGKRILKETGGELWPILIYLSRLSESIFNLSFHKMCSTLDCGQDRMLPLLHIFALVQIISL